MHLIVLAVSLALFAALVGLAVARVLAARDVAEDTDVVRRVMRGGATRRSGKAYLTAVRNELPDALDMIANSLSAGLTLPQAILRNLEHFPPAVGAEFARILYDTSLGFSVAGAFDNFAARLPMQDVRMIAIASKIGVSHGGQLHENYRMLAGLLRDRMAFERELHAMTTEGRMQAIVMSCLPVALILILGGIRPEMMKPLFTTGLGWCVLGLLATMQTLAYVWIKKIVSIET